MVEIVGHDDETIWALGRVGVSKRQRGRNTFGNSISRHGDFRFHRGSRAPELALDDGIVLVLDVDDRYRRG